MKNLQILTGILTLIFYVGSCGSEPCNPVYVKEEPKLINSKKYYEGFVEIPQTNSFNYGLLNLTLNKPGLRKKNQPITGIIYKGSPDLFYGDTISFQIYTQNNISYAKPIQNTENLIFESSIDSISLSVGLMELHIEGIWSTDGGAHSKIHIIRPTGNSITYQGFIYDEVDFNLNPTNNQPEKKIYILRNELNAYYPNQEFPLGKEIDVIFEKTVNISGNSYEIANITDNAEHVYERSNDE